MWFPFTLTNLWNLPGYQIIRLFLQIFYRDVKPYTFENDLPVISSYDFIVVGSGAGGSTIAGRLAETSATVLLLEEGPSATRESIVPYAFPFLGKSKIIAEHRVESQKNAQLDYPDNAGVIRRGVAMGGTTSVNGCQFVKGSRQDFDYWAYLGNKGWDYKSILPYYHKSENYVGEVKPGLEYLHGKGGPITFRSRRYNREFLRIVGRGAKELGFQMIDPSSPRKIGFANVMTNVDKGLRVSTSEAYLRPYAHKPNLTIKPGVTVRKILFDRNKRVLGVEIVMDGRLRRVRAKKEVIVSAGTINSPKLLMLSGVGPADHLREMGIRVVADVVGVGRNYQDHHGVGKLSYKFKNYKESTSNILKILLGLPSYKKTPKGPLTEFGPDGFGFFNVYDRRYKNWPDVAFVMYVLPFVKKLYIHIYLTRPKSRGYVRLRSKNYRDDPIVNPRYFANQDDVKTMILGLKLAHKFASTKSVQEEMKLKFNSEIPSRCRSVRRYSISFWECLARHWIDTYYHNAGTCKMAPDSDPLGVVSPSLKLRGVEGVRVVDASIMPQVVTANVMSTIIAIAEKAADMIKEEHSL